MKTFLVVQTVRHYARISAETMEQALEIAESTGRIDLEDTSTQDEGWEGVCEIVEQ